jgi:hypothetical protein
MNPLYERSILGAIECHEIFGEHDMERKIIKEYKDVKYKSQKKENKVIKKNQIFEGTLVAAGWDRLDHVNQTCLYTQDDEDILLDHNLGIRKFMPYLNQKVRISGDIISTIKDERRVLVKKITRITDGFTKPTIPLRDEFDNLIIPAAS